ncbi:MAG TPA: SpoIIE family protein phosphatase [Mycobacteriales bacterium]|nr:SpoIIE family protein phosphatase [Mycobacteriales bacterium]
MEASPVADVPALAPALAGDPELLAALLDASPVGFALFDGDLRYVHVNASMAAANGLPADDHRGRRPREVVPGIADQVEGHLRAVLSDGRERAGVEITGDDGHGTASHWSTSWFPVRAPGSGRALGVAVVATDVTSIVEAGEAQRETALALQRSLLPDALPASEELEVAVRYAAGGAETEVGGDWYDVIPLGAGRLALVVGDVMGRGVHAAAVMGQLRTAVRTCARLDLRPVEVVEVLDGLVADLGQDDFDAHIATCVYGVFDPHTRELQLASAGHLPPVVRSASGGVQRVDVEVSAPLGVGDAARQVVLRLEPGSVLALCTDGLVEMRGSDLDHGLDALCRAVAAGPQDLEGLADAVLRSLDAGGGDDDVALLLVRVPHDVDSRSLSVSLPVPRERALLIDVRARARAAMESWALLEELVDTATLLASELVTNGLVHGKGGVELRLRLTRDRLVLEVEDAGHHMPRRRRAGTDEESGRGLHLVQVLADRWGARQTDDGKVVWAEIDLAGGR